MKSELPQSVKACLWSYDTNALDLANSDHRSIIIHNVLDIGTMDAVFWLVKNFTQSEIVEHIKNSSSSDWSKKSLSLWSLIFNVSPAKVGRFA